MEVDSDGVTTDLTILNHRAISRRRVADRLVVRATIRTRDHDLLLEIHIETLFTELKYARIFFEIAGQDAKPTNSRQDARRISRQDAKI
jgi:hypothetical protein